MKNMRMATINMSNECLHLELCSQDEDVSEEAVAARHSRSEELERKKFLQYLHMQVTSRSSRSRRTDSSGTNTPGEGVLEATVKVLLVGG